MVSVEQARKDTRNKDLIPDEIVKPIQVARHVTILAMSAAVSVPATEKL